MKSLLTRSLILASLVVSVGAWAAKPIVAVFDIEDQGVGLPADVLGRLSNFLTSGLAAAGHFQVIARSELQTRLRQEKGASYKDCVDQKCQIEIGRELAAQKSLSTKVIKIGSECLVTAVLFDLKKSASEGGARAEGGCAEKDVLASIKKLIEGLRPKVAPGPPPPVARHQARAVPPPINVTIDISTVPSGAEVFTDGQARGRSPLRLQLVKGQPCDLLIEKPGYKSIKKRFTATGRARIALTLTATTEGHRRLALEHATATEWFEVGLGFAQSLKGTFGAVSLRAITLKWNWFSWTILEVTGGLGEHWSNLLGTGWFFSAATAMAVPVRFGARMQHELTFGFGVGYLSIEQADREQAENWFYGKTPLSKNCTRNDPLSHTYEYTCQYIDSVMANAFALSPRIRYVYRASRSHFFGASVGALLPVAGQLRVNYGRGDYLDPADHYAMVFVFNLLWGMN